MRPGHGRRPGAKAPELPDGAGKEEVEAVCTACHQTDQITRSSGYTEDGWKELAGTMIDLSGSPEDRDAITEYLWGTSRRTIAGSQS